MSCRWIALLLLVLAGCGTAEEAKTEPAEPRGPSVASMVEGDSGRVAASDFYVDAKGRVWVNKDASYRPRGTKPADASAIQDSAWLGRLKDRYQVGFELTDPRHLAPRPDATRGRWVQAHVPEAVVARIRAGDYEAARR
jgi:hypothetical protein